MTPVVVVVMGVSGVGKSTVGSALARRLDWTFLEADDEHSPESVAAMARGVGLDDAQRDVWIVAVRDRAARHVAAGENVVVACSALRHAHRKVMRGAGPRVDFVHLVAPADVIAQRLAKRTGHFAGAALLPSQLHDLETPRDAIHVDATQPVSSIVEEIVESLAL